MKTIANIRILLALVPVALIGNAFAQEIYKWTDQDGNVHYGDRPVEGTEQPQLVAIASRRTDAAAVGEAVEARRERDAARAEARTAAREAELAAAEEQKAAEAQAKQCAEYRARLEKFLISRRLYKVDENGQRVFLDAEQQQKARTDLQTRIEEVCSN